MKISIIKGNEKIPVLTRATKSRTECCAEKKCVFKKAVFIKVLSGFQSFAGGGGGEVMKGQRSIIFQVIFHINEHFNNFRK